MYKKGRIVSLPILTVLVMFLILLITNKPIDINASEADMTIEETIIKREFSFVEKGIEIKGEAPELQGLDNKVLESRMNSMINMTYKEMIKEAHASEEKVEFSFEVYQSGDYFSIIIHTRESIEVEDRNLTAFVIDLRSERLVTINDVLGDNGVELLKAFIKAEMKENPDRFYTGVKPQINNHSFYIEDDVLQVSVCAKDITPNEQGLIKFSLPLEKINEIEVGTDRYYQEEPYHIRMIDFSAVADFYEVEYIIDETGEKVSVINKEKEEIAVLTIGENTYESAGVEKILEVAPDMKDDTIYIPISFLKEALDIVYTVNEDGNITFSKWD